MERSRKKENKVVSSFIIFLINIILLAVLVVFFVMYNDYYQNNIKEQNIINIKNLNQSSIELAEKYFENQQKELRNAVQYISRRHMTVEELLEYLRDSNADYAITYELVHSDYTGTLAQRDGDGLYYELDYSSNNYSNMHVLIDETIAQHSDEPGFIPEFTDCHNAIKSFALYQAVPVVREDGTEEYCVLMTISKTKAFSKIIQIEGSYTGLASVMFDSRGDYIVSSDFYKSTNFFQYIYLYNQLTLDQKTALCDDVTSKENGTLFYKNESGQECVFVYQKMSIGNRYIASAIPLSSFKNTNFDYRFTLVVILIFGVWFAIDMFWMRMMNRKLKISMLHEKKANSAKSDFLSRMSHDIRTPLNAVIGFSELAIDEPNLSETVCDSLKKINTSGKYLLNLINDILDMSKIESNKFELHEEPVDGAEVFAEIEEVFQAQALQKGITLKTDFSGIQQVWIYMDTLRNRQIYSNLLNNAIKFSSADTVISWTVTDSMIADNKIKRISVVSDQGCGMSEEFMTNLFRPFVQERNTHSDKEGGTGLGLAIVKNLVELMGGTVEVTSTLGKGSSFKIVVEHTLVPKEEIKQQMLLRDENMQKAIDRKRIESLSGRKILLCEDHPLNRQIAVKVLEKKGIIVSCAENGKQAVECYQNSQNGYFDYILMDIRMPIMDGLEATKCIRALDRKDAAEIPIIAMTANAFEDDIERCREAGMNDHIAKPVEPEIIYKTLEKYL